MTAHQPTATLPYAQLTRPRHGVGDAADTPEYTYHVTALAAPGSAPQAAVSRWTQAASIRSRMGKLQLHTIDLPAVGKVPVPDRRDVVYVTTVAALITVGVIELPIALAVLGVHLLGKQHHSRSLSAVGEVLEDFWLR
jgi:hypothetical protein